MALRSDNPTAVARPSRRRLANAIRMLSMDAVEAAQLGPSRHADGHGRHRRGALERLPQIQSGQWPLARPRSVRALERPRLDAAVLGRLPHGLRDRARRAEELPPARLARSRASGARARARHRDDDGAARPRPRECRRHGARREASRGRVQSARLADRRSPHVRVPRRRLPDGRHLARGVLVRRHAEARQADRLLRRQRHLDRRRDARLVHGRHAEALRSVRLARRAERRRPRSRTRFDARDRRGARREDSARR